MQDICYLVVSTAGTTHLLHSSAQKSLTNVSEYFLKAQHSKALIR